MLPRRLADRLTAPTSSSTRRVVRSRGPRTDATRSASGAADASSSRTSMRSSSRCRTTSCRRSRWPANGCGARWRRTSLTTTRRATTCASRYSSTGRSGAGCSPARGSCSTRSAAAASTTKVARHDAGDYGVLGWLLAGADALSLCNADDRTLVARVLDSLPDELYDEACAARRRRKGAPVGGGRQRTAGRIPGARPARGASARAGRASGPRRRRRLSLRFDVERRASIGEHRDRAGSRKGHRSLHTGGRGLGVARLGRGPRLLRSAR